MSRAWCTVIPTGIRLTVQIMPNAKKSEVIGLLDDTLKIRLQAQPIEGKANEALIRFIADTLNLPRNNVCITHGLTNKRKMLEIHASDLTLDAMQQAFFRKA
jgi:uncharacterized protein (TIGR00251 family)